MFAVTVELRWEYVAVAVAVVAGLIYFGTLVRRLVHAVDRWERLPKVFDDVEAIKDQVVPPDADPDTPPLHRRVDQLEAAARSLEFEVAAIRSEMATGQQLVEHTEQDAAHFGEITGRLDAALHPEEGTT